MHEIRSELRELCAQHVNPEDLAWLVEHFPNVWPRPMQQLDLFT